MKTEIDTFLAGLSVRRAERTVIAYRTALNRFVKCLGDPDAPTLTLQHISAFANTVGHEVAPTTINLYLVAVHRFYRWLISQGTLDINGVALEEFVANLKSSHPRRLPRVPNEGGVRALLDQARASADKRALALVETLRSTGCRIGEVVALRRRDLGYERAMVTGKGQKQRLVFFDEAAWSAMEAHLEGRSLLPDDYVFVGTSNNATGHLSTQAARAIIRGLCQEAGIDNINPHALRHRFGTAILEATNNLAVVQDMMGHSSPTTTRIYAQVTGNGLAEAHRVARL